MAQGTSFFNPWPYQPQLQAFYLGRPLPAEIAAKAAQQPEIAQHLNSVWQFSTWLNQFFPAMAATITGSNPALLDPVAVVTSGKLAPGGTSPKPSGKKGMGDITFTYDPSVDYGASVPAGSTSVVSNPASQSSAVTEWGKTVADLLGKYLVYDQQKKIIDLNIKRAEQGLPPVDSSMYGAGVNVGLSPQVQKLAMFAVGGLVVVGLLNSMKRK